MGERIVVQSIGFWCHEKHVQCSQASFLKTPKLRKWSIDQGNLCEENSSNAQIRTLLDEQRQMIVAEYCEKIGHYELQAARAEGRTPNSTRKNYGASKRIFVKFIN